MAGHGGTAMAGACAAAVGGEALGCRHTAVPHSWAPGPPDAPVEGSTTNQPQAVAAPRTSSNAQRAGIGECGVCLDAPCDTALGCGHLTCARCSVLCAQCPYCRTAILQRLRLWAA